MDLQKLIGKNKAAAENIVEDLTRETGRNQKQLQRNVADHKALIEEGKDLAVKLAAAMEYLQDLIEAETN